MKQSEYYKSLSKNQITENRFTSTFIHFVFWLSYFVLSYFILTKITGNAKASLGIAFINVIGIIPLVYFFINFLIPRYWFSSTYISFFSLLIFAAIVSALIRFSLVRLLIYETFHIDLDITEFQIIAQFLVGSFSLLILAIPLKISDVYLKNRALHNEFDRHKLEAELRFLKTQVNPHFLFNSLNNIYSLAFTNSSSTAEMILKLSQMMRFMLYDCQDKTIMLEKEIEYLYNYIALQQLRQEGELNIIFDVLGIVDDIEITPMLFIPFFENAIKHGNVDNSSEGYIQSKLILEEGKINFKIKNSIEPSIQLSTEKGGIGIVNVKDRLQLLYPSRHVFTIKESPDSFEVFLEIELL